MINDLKYSKILKKIKEKEENIVTRRRASHLFCSVAVTE